jgi:hypothetical protein
MHNAIKLIIETNIITIEVIKTQMKPFYIKNVT